MTLRSATTWVVIAIGLTVAGQVMAAKRTHTTTTTTRTHMTASERFAKDAAMGGMAEVELGKLGVERATNADVKTFAQKMVDDHGAANTELQTLAQQKNWTLPTAMDAKHRSLQAKLQKLNGSAFDRAYMNAMMSDHHHDVAKFRQYSKTGTDADLKAWVQKTLPTLEQHMDLSMSTAKAVGLRSTMKPMATTP